MGTEGRDRGYLILRHLLLYVGIGSRGRKDSIGKTHATYHEKIELFIGIVAVLME